MNLELFFAWCKFWVCVWFGTTVSGSLFGLGLTLVVTVVQDPASSWGAAFFGLLVGALWAGIVGVVIIPSFALLMYDCFCIRKPPVLACVAGALTGTVSMPPLFFITGPIGAVGAYFCAQWFLSIPDSWLLREAEQRRIDNKNQPFNFSIASLLARTTAVALLVSIWTFLARNLFGAI